MSSKNLYSSLVLMTIVSFFLYNAGTKPRTPQKISNKIIVPNTIPTLQLASAIGESVLKEKYGDEVIEKQKPFAISLKDNVWTLDGQKNNGQMSSHIEICKTTGAILTIK